MNEGFSVFAANFVMICFLVKMFASFVCVCHCNLLLYSLFHDPIQDYLLEQYDVTNILIV